jgi:hypothetical protein
MVFNIPGDVAESLGLTNRSIIGEMTGMKPVDIPHGTGYERILPSSQVPAFNQALKNGQIGVTLRPVVHS